MERGGDIENGRPDKQHTQAPRVFPPSSSRSTTKISSAGPAWRRGKEIAIYASLRGSARQFGLPSPLLPILWMISALFGGRAQRSSLANRFVKKFYSSLPPTFSFSPMSFFFFRQKNEQQPQTTSASLQAISPRGKLGGGRSASKGGRRSEFVKKSWICDPSCSTFVLRLLLLREILHISLFLLASSSSLSV